MPTILKRFWHSLRGTNGAPGLAPEVQAFLREEYPSNHAYQVVSRRLVPARKLASRYRQIARHYPEVLTSLLDLSCCKGYFVFAAAEQPTCRRALGIDIDDEFLGACRSVQQHLQYAGVRFEKLYLHQLAERIDEFGGPFQTVSLINTYPYFYFGSSRSPQQYATHREIFGLIRRVCADRVIFNNRTEVEDCHGGTRQLAGESGKASAYHTQAILDAASEFFAIPVRSDLGRRPLLVLQVR